MPHDAWRDFLPYYIAAYKGQTPNITTDKMQYWYRLSPAAGGTSCGVTGNSASQGQAVEDPNTVVEDGVFMSALLVSDAQVSLQIGGGAKTVFAGKKGVNHWSVPFGGQTGNTTFAIERNGKTVKSGNGAGIKATSDVAGGCTNYNAWVGGF
jgi:glucan endo-1,3-alpha-glucosidase